MAQLKCRKCGSTDVTVQFVQTGSKTKSKTKGRGCLGKLFWLFAFFPMLFLRKKKYKTKSNTTVQNEKVAVCNNCGHSWALKK